MVPEQREALDEIIVKIRAGRISRRTFLERAGALGLTATGFDLEADLFAECALKGIPITEVPIRYDRRIGHPKLHLHEGFRIALALDKPAGRPGHALRTDERGTVANFIAARFPECLDAGAERSIWSIQ